MNKESRYIVDCYGLVVDMPKIKFSDGFIMSIPASDLPFYLKEPSCEIVPRNCVLPQK